MRFISEKTALERLAEIRSRFAERIRHDFEHAAKDCLTCETKGACCLDAHFVNIRLTRLEAVAIVREIEQLPAEKQASIRRKILDTVERFGLENAAEDNQQTYACPLFERDTGCLVHHTAKPLPCIAHACYERKEDLPPDELLQEREVRVFELSRRTYGSGALPRSLPVALKHLLKARTSAT